MASAVAQTLSSVHEELLQIAPPSRPAARLAFARGRLAQASRERVLFRDTKQGEIITEENIGPVLAVASGADGALFALGASAGVRLGPERKKAMHFPRVPFLPGAMLFGDLERPSHFYVLYPVEQELYSYPFEVEAGAFLPIEARFPVTGCSGALALLRDGAFVCRTAVGFARQAPRGQRTQFDTTKAPAEPFRLLPAKRLDEFFALSTPDEVQHVRLAAGLPVLGRFRLGAPAYAAEANAEALAFVTVSPAQQGQPRRWSLLVTDFEGKLRFQVELPSSRASASEDWLETLVADKNLALSSSEPLVAVGGPGQVSVWDYGLGQLRFSR